MFLANDSSNKINVSPACIYIFNCESMVYVFLSLRIYLYLCAHSHSHSPFRSSFDILWTLMRLKIWCWKISTACMQYFGIKLKYSIYHIYIYILIPWEWLYFSLKKERRKNPHLPRIAFIWHKNLMLQIKFVFT